MCVQLRRHTSDYHRRRMDKQCNEVLLICYLENHVGCSLSDTQPGEQFSSLKLHGHCGRKLHWEWIVTVHVEVVTAKLCAWAELP